MEIERDVWGNLIQAPVGRSPEGVEAKIYFIVYL